MGAQEITEGLLRYTDTAYRIDMLSIYNTAEIIGDVTGIILGLIAYSIAVFMTLITVADIAYITLPIFRDRIRELKWDGSNKFGIGAVSKDAIASVEESYTMNLDKSALTLYIGKRTISYILAVFVLFLILGGMGYIKDIVVLVVKSVLLATLG